MPTDVPTIPFVSSEVCYQYVELRKIVETTTAISNIGKFIDDFCKHFNLELTIKSALQRHIGPESTYTYKHKLIEALSYLHSQDKLGKDMMLSIAMKLGESESDYRVCTQGFHDRVNEALLSLTTPKNIPEMLMQSRGDLTLRAATESGVTEVHTMNQYTVVANLAGYGVKVTNPDDPYVGSDRESPIRTRLQRTFSAHFQFTDILSDLADRITHTLKLVGEYKGRLVLPEDYKGGSIEKFTTFFTSLNLKDPSNKPINIQQFFIQEWHDGSCFTTDINWTKVKQALFDSLCVGGYLRFPETTKSSLRELIHTDKNNCGFFKQTSMPITGVYVEVSTFQEDGSEIKSCRFIPNGVIDDVSEEERRRLCFKIEDGKLIRKPLVITGKSVSVEGVVVASEGTLTEGSEIGEALIPKKMDFLAFEQLATFNVIAANGSLYYTDQTTCEVVRVDKEALSEADRTTYDLLLSRMNDEHQIATDEELLFIKTITHRSNPALPTREQITQEFKNLNLDTHHLCLFLELTDPTTWVEVKQEIIRDHVSRQATEVDKAKAIEILLSALDKFRDVNDPLIDIVVARFDKKMKPIFELDSFKKPANREALFRRISKLPRDEQGNVLSKITQGKFSNLLLTITQYAPTSIELIEPLIIEGIKKPLHEQKELLKSFEGGIHSDFLSVAIRYEHSLFQRIVASLDEAVPPSPSFMNFMTFEDGKSNILHSAVQHNALDNLRLLLRKGGNRFINSVDPHGNTPLHLAILQKKPEMVDLLLADPLVNLSLKNRSNQSLIDLALKSKDLNLLSNLLTHLLNKSSEEQQALEKALKFKIAEVIAKYLPKTNNEVFLKTMLLHAATLPLKKQTTFLKGIEGNHSSVLTLAAGLSHATFQAVLAKITDLCPPGPTIEQTLNHLPGGSHALLWATGHGQHENINVLLSIGNSNINITNSNGSTALIIAAYLTKPAAMEVLLQHRNIKIDIRNKLGKSVFDLLFLHDPSADHQKMIAALLPKAAVLPLCVQEDLLSSNFGYYPNMLTLAAKYPIDTFKKVVQAIKNGGPPGPTLQETFDYKVGHSNFPLHMASEYGHTENVQLLIDEGCPINKRNPNDDTALTIAASKGHLELFKILLLQEGIDLSLRNRQGKNVFDLVQGPMKNEMIKLLLNKAIGKTPSVQKELLSHMEGGVFQTMISLAVTQDLSTFQNIIKALSLSREALLELAETTPLLFHMVNAKQTENLRYLFNFGCDCAIKNAEGDTLLICATRLGIKSMIPLFMTYPATFLLSRNKQGQNALDVAVSGHHDETIDILTIKAASLSLQDQKEFLKNVEGGYFQDVLSFAASRNFDVFQKVLDQSHAMMADVPPAEVEASASPVVVDTSPAQSLLSAFDAAVKHNQTEIIRRLLNEDPRMDTEQPNKAGNTPLMIAVMHGNKELVERFLKENVQMMPKNKMQQNVFDLASKHHPELTETLLLHVRNLPFEQQKALLKSTGFTSVLSYLIRTFPKKHEDICLEQIEKLTLEELEINPVILCLAAANNCPTLIRALLKKGYDINKKNSDGFTPLSLASSGGFLESVKALLEHEDIDIAFRSSKKTNCLDVSSYYPNPELQRCLLVKAASLSLEAQKEFLKNVRGGEYANVLQYADATNDLELKRQVLEKYKGKRLNTIDLINAVKHGSTSIVEFYLTNQFFDIDAVDSMNYSALHWAIVLGQEQMINALIAADADLSLVGANGRNALGDAFAKHSVSIELILVKALSLPLETQKKLLGDFAHPYGGDHFTNVFNFTLAHFKNNPYLVLGSDGLTLEQLEEPNLQGLTSLHMAIKYGRLAAVKLLLEKGCRVQSVTLSEETTLDLAVKENNMAIVELLLIKISELPLNEQQTLLSRVAEGQYPNVLSYAASLSAVTFANIVGAMPMDDLTRSWDHARESLLPSPLHIAAKHDIVPNLSLLLSDKRVDVNALDQEENTALQVAAIYKKIGSIEELLKHPEIQLTHRNALGRSVLDLASKEILAPILSHLLTLPEKDQADLLSTYQEGQYPTVLSIAATLKAENFKALLTQIKKGYDGGSIPRSPLELPDKDGQTPLHLATASGFEDNVRLLCDEGSDVLALDSHQNTPLHLARTPEVVEALLKRPEINLTLRNDQGQNPFDVALLKGDKKIMGHLLSHISALNVERQQEILAQIPGGPHPQWIYYIAKHHGDLLPEILNSYKTPDDLLAAVYQGSPNALQMATGDLIVFQRLFTALMENSKIKATHHFDLNGVFNKDTNEEVLSRIGTFLNQLPPAIQSLNFLTGLPLNLNQVLVALPLTVTTITLFDGVSLSVPLLRHCCHGPLVTQLDTMNPPHIEATCRALSNDLISILIKNPAVITQLGTLTLEKQEAALKGFLPWNLRLLMNAPTIVRQLFLNALNGENIFYNLMSDSEADCSRVAEALADFMHVLVKNPDFMKNIKVFYDKFPNKCAPFLTHFRSPLLSALIEKNPPRFNEEFKAMILRGEEQAQTGYQLALKTAIELRDIPYLMELLQSPRMKTTSEELKISLLKTIPQEEKRELFKAVLKLQPGDIYRRKFAEMILNDEFLLHHYFEKTPERSRMDAATCKSEKKISLENAKLWEHVKKFARAVETEPAPAATITTGLRAELHHLRNGEKATSHRPHLGEC